MMKLITRIGLAVVFALVGFGCAASQSGRSVNVTDVQEFEVDGVKVLLKQSTESPVVSAFLYIRGGSSAMPVTKPLTVESFALNVNAASGTRSTSKALYRQKMLRMGSGIGGQDSRDYSLMLMRSTREHFDTTWKFFAEKITSPVFDPIEFANLKKNALLNIQAVTANPAGYSRYLLDSIYYSGHPYGRRTSAADIERTTIASMEQHMKEIMVKSRLALVVVGPVSREEITRKLREGGVTSLPEGNYVTPPLAPSANSAKPNVVIVRSPRKLPTNYVIGYFKIPARGSADYYPYMRMRYFLGSNLFNRIRVEHALAYAPSLDESEWADPVGVITFETAHVDSAINLVYEDVEFFQNYILRQSAISGNVDRLATSIFMEQETSQSQAEAIGEAFIMTGDWRNAFMSPEKLAAVTSQELNQAAKTYLRNFNWLVLGDSVTISQLR
ncbi:MAG TPA: insulinase family protein [Candidatus Kapabacteria bacterium]|nr:insulinase family protein [Candidatus Kapabacteria bacterium]